MKTAISLPDAVFRAAERVSRRKRMSRSEFYTNAIRRYVQQEENAGITEQLNRVYAHERGDGDAVETTGIRDLGANDWR